MLVLDTNHLRELALRTPLGLQLQQRMNDSGQDCVFAVVSAEETLRGDAEALAIRTRRLGARGGMPAFPS